MNILDRRSFKQLIPCARLNFLAQQQPFYRLINSNFLIIAMVLFLLLLLFLQKSYQLHTQIYLNQFFLLEYIKFSSILQSSSSSASIKINIVTCCILAFPTLRAFGYALIILIYYDNALINLL